MQGSTRIIVGILADTDALFAPNRSWLRPRPTVIYEQRRDYRGGGVPWRSAAHDEAGRKAMQRELESLCAGPGGGLVKTFRPQRVKTLGVKLTAKGEALGRALCGLPNLDQSIGGVMHIVMHSDDSDAGVSFDGRLWVAETALAGVDWVQCATDAEARQNLVYMEGVLLPSLIRGWVMSNSNNRGQVWYSLTTAGVAMLEAERRKPDPPPHRLTHHPRPLRHNSMRKRRRITLSGSRRLPGTSTWPLLNVRASWVIFRCRCPCRVAGADEGGGKWFPPGVLTRRWHRQELRVNVDFLSARFLLCSGADVRRCMALAVFIGVWAVEAAAVAASSFSCLSCRPLCVR